VSDVEGLARRFPAGFLFGAATAAYQIEGAHDADGKGPSIWDTFTRRPGAIARGETGDVACDHYRRWREDVELMRALGLSAYRFSISWPRVLPEGSGKVNERGLDFYQRVIDALLARQIRPFVTLYHWDLPEALQKRGGWSHPDAPKWFGEYAQLIGQRLGDRVVDWITLNEPAVSAFAGHESGDHAPGVRDRAVALRAAHHLLLAHREAARALRASGRRASVGIALNLSPAHPASESEADAAAAERQDGALNRWFLDPLFARGYPRDVAEWNALLFAERLEGYDGGLDFVGVNYYTRAVVRAAESGPKRLESVRPETSEYTAMSWEVYPDGLREILTRVWRDYAPQAIYVTENGAAFDDVLDASDRVPDERRSAFLAAHLSAAADALEQGVPLRGYFVWSLYDNFEWAHGFAKRFGLVYLDYPTQRRIIKASGEWYRALIEAAAAVRV
jgi:beta-glucosidase